MTKNDVFWDKRHKQGVSRNDNFRLYNRSNKRVNGLDNPQGQPEGIPPLGKEAEIETALFRKDSARLDMLRSSRNAQIKMKEENPGEFAADFPYKQPFQNTILIFPITWHNGSQARV